MSAATFRKTSWAILAALTVFSAAAQAAEVTRVVSAFDDDGGFDINLTASWLHEAKSALIKRESESMVASAIQVLPDLKYARTRDVLNLRVDFGILWDVGLHVEAPLVLADSNTRKIDLHTVAALLHRHLHRQMLAAGSPVIVEEPFRSVVAIGNLGDLTAQHRFGVIHQLPRRPKYVFFPVSDEQFLKPLDAQFG